MTSPEDPRETIKNILSDPATGVKLKKDDGVTDATISVADEYIEDFFEKYDVVLTVGPGTVNETMPFIGASYKRVVANYGVGLWTRDKTGITGRRILWDAHCEVSRVIGAKATDPGGILQTIKVLSRVPNPRVDVKPAFFHDVVMVSTRRTSPLGDA